MSVEMDEDFVYFYETKGFGPTTDSRPVAPGTAARFQGKLPDQLLAYWERFGFCGFARGLVWLVDPDEYEPALEAWIGDTRLMEIDAYYVIGRSAFGELFLWGTRTGQSLTIQGWTGMIFPTDDSERVARGESDRLAKYFLLGQKKADLDQSDELGRPLFERAVKRLGVLNSDEIYGFEPALALGGRAELKNLRKVKAVEHLVILAQLGERQIMRDVVKEAKSAGLL